MAKLCKAGAGMSLGKWWLWALLGLLALYCLMILNKWRAIESDIQTRTQSALQSGGFDWAGVDQTDHGRDVTITGSAPSTDAVTAAVSLANQVEGVRVVDHATQLIEWVSSNINIASSDGMTMLSGELQDQASIDKVVMRVADVVGADNVDNQLTISRTAKEAAWLDNLGDSVAALSTLKAAKITANDEGLMVSGEVKTQQGFDQVSRLFSSQFGDKYSGEIDITGPSAEELAQIEAERIAKLKAEEEAARMAAAKEEQRRLEMERLEAQRLTKIKAELAAKNIAEELAEQARLEEIQARAMSKLKAEEAARKIAEELAEQARLEEIQARAMSKLKAEEAARKIAAELAEQARLDELQAKKLAMETAEEAAKLAERKRLEAEQEAQRKAAQEAARIAAEKAKRQSVLADCQTKLNQVMAESKVEFATASANIQAESYSMLAQIVNLLNECGKVGDVKIEISGHTDATGDETMNQSLSEVRARSVMDYLLDAGVDNNMLSAKGYGETQPIAENNTANGRAQNRRIQFDIQQ